MKEQATILSEARRLRRAGRAFGLATVVKVNGSAYRRPGARMLVTPEGTHVGTISGGCLEAEVAQHALQVLEAGVPRVETFDLADDDLILGFGIGCDGMVHVLIEPIAPERADDPLSLTGACLDRRRPGVLATVTGFPEATVLAQHLLFFEDGTELGAIDVEPLRTRVRKEVSDVFAHGRPQIRQYALEDGAAEVLFNVVQPPVHLLIFGGGHDVRPVVRMAKELGWRTTVVGRKTKEELTARFPAADAHVFLMNPEDAQGAVPLDARSPVVVMNHNYVRDKTLVGGLLGADVPYVGVLGPRHRTDRIVEELLAEHDALTEEHLDRLHGPAGLDLGTEAPEEIALAIMAEVQAVLNGRSAQKLREREGSIHHEVPIA